MGLSSHASALLLRSVDYGDSDRVVTLFTREHGKVSCLAKGARSSRRRLSGLQVFSLLDIELRHKTQGLDQLLQARPRAFAGGLLSDLSALAHAYVLLELTDRFEELGSPQPQVFDLLWASLLALADGAPLAWTRCSFSLRLLDLAGLAPDLDACRACGREWPLLQTWLSAEQGGWLCGACAGARKLAGPGLDQAQAESLRVAMAGSPQRPTISPAASGAVERLMEYHLGRSLKSGAALESLLAPLPQ